MPTWLSGWKTYAAAVLAAFVAANGVLGWVSPEAQNTILAVATALGLWGLRDASGRIEKKLDQGTDIIRMESRMESRMDPKLRR